MPSQFTIRRWMRNKGPLIKNRPAGWSLARFPRTEEGRKGFSPAGSRASERTRASAPTATRRGSLRLEGRLLATALPRRNAHDLRSAVGRPTGRGRGGLLTMHDQFSRILFHRRGCGCTQTHTCVRVYTYTERIRHNSRSASASHQFYRTRARLEVDTCQISSRGIYTDAGSRQRRFFFFFFSYDSRISLIRQMHVRDKSSKILEIHNFPWCLHEMIESDRLCISKMEYCFIN